VERFCVRFGNGVCLCLELKQTNSAAKGCKAHHRQRAVGGSPKGKQTVPIPPGITLRQQNGTLELQRDGNDKAALHGLTRALAANAVQGLSSGLHASSSFSGSVISAR